MKDNLFIFRFKSASACSKKLQTSKHFMDDALKAWAEVPLHLKFYLTLWRGKGRGLFCLSERAQKSAFHVFIDSLAQSGGGLWPKLPQKTRFWALAVLNGLNVKLLRLSYCWFSPSKFLATRLS